MARGIRDIAGEAILLAGGGRAILMQIAHPAVGRGVAEHSDFAAQPLDRLHATMTYIYAVVYGTQAEIAAVRRRVNLAHSPVHYSPVHDSPVHDSPVHDAAAGTGPAYDAFDADLQLWVAATLYETAVDLYQRIFGPFDEESAERIYREYGVLGTSLQVPAGAWPENRTAFLAYWNSVVPTLRATDATRRVARELLRPSAVPLWLKAMMPLARLMTVGLLPEQLRAEFGLAMTPRNDRRFRRWVRIMAAVFPRLPARIRHSLRDHELAELRRSVNEPVPNEQAG